MPSGMPSTVGESHAFQDLIYEFTNRVSVSVSKEMTRTAEFMNTSTTHTAAVPDHGIYHSRARRFARGKCVL